MKSLDMTKEQLIKYINAQNKKKQNSDCTEAPGKNPDTNTPSVHEQLGFLSGTPSIGLIITDTNGTIVSFNKTIRDLLGITVDELKNTNVSIYTPIQTTANTC